MVVAFAVSTVAFSSDIHEAIRIAQKHGLTVEFGSGIPHQPDLRKTYEELELPRLPHNYFPAPADPFVVNLASRDASIRERSIKHCIQGLEMAQASGAPFFAAHSGFCTDPDPEELGAAFEISHDGQHAEHEQRFRASVRRIAEKARDLDTDFLIENNVASSSNYDPVRDSVPLLWSRPAEIVEGLETIDCSEVALLLDTGHLKVSAQTLGFKRDEAVQKLAPYVRGIHHSDNDGTEDTNEPLTDDYWFLEHMPQFDEVLHVLEVKSQPINEILRQRKLLNTASKSKATSRSS